MTTIVSMHSIREQNDASSEQMLQSQALAAPAQESPAGQESRRLKLLRRIGLFTSDTKGAVIERATCGSDLIAAYRLVHDIFVEENYIKPQEGGLRVRPFECVPESGTCVARTGSRIVGVQTLAVDSDDFGLPSDISFRDVLDTLRGDGRLVCEATNEAIAKELRRSAVPTELMRCMFAYAVSIGCTELITTISPGHATFYEFVGFRQVSDVRSYTSKIDDPVVVVSANLAEAKRRYETGIANGDADCTFLNNFYFDQNPYTVRQAEWTEQANASFRDPQFLTELCHRTGFLRHATPSVLDAMRTRLGAALFAQVLHGAGEASAVGSRPSGDRPRGNVPMPARGGSWNRGRLRDVFTRLHRRFVGATL